MRTPFDLSFTAFKPDTQDFWNPDRSGSYTECCARGRAYAKELIKHIRDTENPTVFGSVVRAISASGRYEGIEIGFCTEVGVQLLGR